MRLHAWILRLFKAKQTAQTHESFTSPTLVKIVDRNDNKTLLEIDPYKFGVVKIVGINRYVYSLQINNKEILRLKPNTKAKIPLGVIDAGSEKVIRCHSFTWSDPSYASTLIKYA